MNDSVLRLIRVESGVLLGMWLARAYGRLKARDPRKAAGIARRMYGFAILLDVPFLLLALVSALGEGDRTGPLVLSAGLLGLLMLCVARWRAAHRTLRRWR